MSSPSLKPKGPSRPVFLILGRQRPRIRSPNGGCEPRRKQRERKDSLKPPHTPTDRCLNRLPSSLSHLILNKGHDRILVVLDSYEHTNINTYICMYTHTNIYLSNRVQCKATQRNEMQCNAMKYSTTQFNTIQVNTTQYGTMQYNTMQP